MKKYCIVFIILSVFAASHLSAGGGVQKLNPAVRKAASYLKKKLPDDGSKLAVFSLHSNVLENFFVDELTDGLSNTTSFNIVDRTQLAAIAQEMGFQLSGEVSETDQIQMGKKAGAQRVISVSVQNMGQQQYRFRVRAIDVETARLYGASSFTVSDPAIDSMLRHSGATPPDPSPQAGGGRQSATDPPPSDLAGSFANPILLPVNDTWNSQTLRTSEMWFKLTPAAAGALVVETDGGLDTYMELFDASRNRLSYNDDNGSSLNARIEWNVTSGGNYLIRVIDVDKAVGPFRIKANAAARAAQTPPNPQTARSPQTPPKPIDLTGSTEAVFEITTGNSYVNRFAKAGAIHLYSLGIPSGYRSITIYTEGGRDVSMAIITLAGMARYLADGTDAVSSGDVLGNSTGRGNANVTFAAPRDSTCYILVGEANDKTGLYTLIARGVR
ncbi:MAG: penicillin-binding protein activator LpoB [Treponema sp.]|nr:penicillin-binding protein activator LpoB [Treponema sp.]